jgi:hypothetical protein
VLKLWAAFFFLFWTFLDDPRLVFEGSMYFSGLSPGRPLFHTQKMCLTYLLLA